MGLYSLLFILSLISLTLSSSIFDQRSKGRCVPMTLPLCAGINYNMTFYPNPLATIEQTQMNHFNPLIKTKCHKHLQFFLCSVFAPMCAEEVPSPVTSCRSVCEEVKRDCMPILEEISIAWPEHLECSRFPSLPDLCMEPKDKEQHRLSPQGVCPSFLVDYDASNPTAHCALPCEGDTIFEALDKLEFRRWLPLAAGASCAISLFTFLTFLVDKQRFCFPERCVFYLALCYFFFSLPYLYSLLTPETPLACHTPSIGKQYMSMRDMDSLSCTLSFLFTYYFSMASSFWWLMFASTWYFSAVRKWASEGLDAIAAKVHVIAWFGPVALTIIVLATNSVDASELTGLCGTGNLNKTALLYFSILPRALTEGLGILFLVRGIASICSDRTELRRKGIDVSKLDKLMLKTCLFSLLHVVPWLCFAAADLYHYAQLQAWEDTTIGCKTSLSPCMTVPPRPNGDVYLLQAAASLLFFIAPCVFVVSRKTLYSWQSCLCFCCYRPTPPAKTSTRPLLDNQVPLPHTAPPRGLISAQYAPLSNPPHHAPQWMQTHPINTRNNRV